MASVTGIIELHGHILDSLTLSKVLDAIQDEGADFDTEAIVIGKTRGESSFARVRITAASQQQLSKLMERVALLGADRLD
ncbi:MAG TPA: hypothetical protein VIU29_03530 [Candidatus Deferrimicrobiaceae bacterium]